VEALIPFAAIYLYESGSSPFVTIKTRNRNLLDVQYDMRAALIQAKQQQSSH
jgi:hypothetical protein